MKTTAIRFLLLCASALPVVRGDSISFATDAKIDWGGTQLDDPNSSSNIGFPFISSAEDYGFDLFARYNASAISSVNGFIAVASRVQNWESTGPTVDSKASWTGDFTNPYPDATSFDIKLSFGGGSISSTLGNDPQFFPVNDSDVNASALLSVNGNATLILSATAGWQHGVAFFRSGPDHSPAIWQPVSITPTSIAYSFSPFETHLTTGPIAPGASFEIAYDLEIANRVLFGFGGSGGAAYLNDPFDVNGNLRTAAPADFGFISITPANSSVPEPSTFWMLALCLAAAFLHRNLGRRKMFP